MLMSGCITASANHDAFVGDETCLRLMRACAVVMMHKWSFLSEYRSVPPFSKSAVMTFKGGSASG